MGKKIHVESFTLNITDNTAVAKNGGIPHGYVEGDVEASGEIVVDAANLMLISAAAKLAGSWRDLPVFNIDAYATGTNPTMGIEVTAVRAHGCKLKLSDVANVDPNSTDKSTYTLQYDVTSPDFVWLNGPPYLPDSEFSLF